MIYTIEMALGGLMYMPSFIKISLGVQKLVDTCAQTARWFHKPSFIFLNKESRLKVTQSRKYAQVIYKLK
jgi:hypothetical protein